MILPYKDIHPEISNDVFIAETAVVTGDVKIGERASIWFGAAIRGDVAPTRIGQDVIIQDNCTLHQSPGVNMVTEDKVIIGHNAVLHSCHVCQGALIGINAVILDGAVIGENAMVAAGAVVPPGKEIPSNTLAIGAPAKSTRELTRKEIDNMSGIRSRYNEKRLYYQQLQTDQTYGHKISPENGS